MKKTIVDSNIWISLHVENNEIGRKFRNWFKSQDEKKIQIIVTYGIITEVIAMVLKKKGFKKAKSILEEFINSEKIRIYNKSIELFDDIVQIFNTYEVLSLVDAELVLLYHNLRCNQLISTDKGFKYCHGIDIYSIPQ